MELLNNSKNDNLQLIKLIYRGNQMIAKKSYLLFVPVFIMGITQINANSACDCGSTDKSNPCTGKSIIVTVNAGTPNGGKPLNNVYNWEFNSGGNDALCGQFANGDYWIAPANGQSSVTITGISSSSHPSFISADVNPKTEKIGLLSGAKAYGNFSASESIIPNLPLSYSTTTSLVAAIQRNEAAEGNCGTSSIVGECADSYNVVTILSFIPDLSGAETIRPNITGESKEILSFSDFDLTRVPGKSYLSGTDSVGIAAIKDRWSHSVEVLGLNTSANSNNGYSEGGRAFRSHVLIDDYGGGAAAAWYNDLMTLFSSGNTIAEKKPAIAAMLAYGLDLYHAIYDSPLGVTRYWGSGATQHPGKFIPVVFLAALAKDPKYATNAKLASSHLWDIRFSGPAEMAQVLPGINGPVWGDIQPQLSAVNYHGAYWKELMTAQCYDGASGTCNNTVGAKNMLDPYKYIDGPPALPGKGYMASSLGVQRALVATMFIMPEVCEIINYDVLVQYVDRASDYGVKTNSDPCVTPDSREDFVNCDPYRNTGCLYYGKTWGPQIPTDMNSGCITTPMPPYTKSGRFSNINGTAISTTYTVGQVEANWAKLRGTSKTCRAPFGGKASAQ